jgi:hypothetical protein
MSDTTIPPGLVVWLSEYLEFKLQGRLLKFKKRTNEENQVARMRREVLRPGIGLVSTRPSGGVA